MNPDRTLDRRFLASVHRLVQSGFGIDADDFLARAENRLELGQARFGDRYLRPGFDCMAEAAEEAEDLLVYCLLALRRADHAGEVDPDARDHLTRAAAAAAAADHHATRARERIAQEARS